MNFTTYAELQSAIADELNRTDLTNAITGFIRLAESQTERQIRVREMIESDTAFVINSELEALPSGFLETRALYLNVVPVVPLTFRTLESMQQFKQENQGVGMPSEYTIIGSNFQFLQAPDTAYTATLIYYEEIPKLSVSNTTNWLLTKHPDIYFYGALLNSAPYLKEDARIQIWASMYQNAVDSLKVADQRSQTASSGLKSQARTF